MSPGEHGDRGGLGERSDAGGSGERTDGGRPMDPRRARVFGSFAHDYDRWRPSYPLDAVRWLVPEAATVVADVGAGTGKLTGVLLDLGVSVLAVEPDPDMLAVLVSRYPAAQPLNSPAEQLPLADASVDAVLVAQAWHWFDHERALAEVRRVLRPGGWLGIVGNGPGAEVREPWLDELAALHPESGRTDDPPNDAENPWADQGLAGLRFESQLFPWAVHRSPAAVRALVATHSIIAVMPADERDELLDRMAAVVQAEADRRGLTELPFNQIAHCVRVYV